jgi:hypothetical protein
MFSDLLFLDLDNNISFYISHEERGVKKGFKWWRMKDSVSDCNVLGPITFYT